MSILSINLNRRLWRPSEKAEFVSSENEPSETPTGNKLQQFDCATAFASVLLVITLNPMGQTKHQISECILASGHKPQH